MPLNLHTFSIDFPLPFKKYLIGFSSRYLMHMIQITKGIKGYTVNHESSSRICSPLPLSSHPTIHTSFVQIIQRWYVCHTLTTVYIERCIYNINLCVCCHYSFLQKCIQRYFCVMLFHFKNASWRSFSNNMLVY